jgi:hypothetical protein
MPGQLISQKTLKKSARNKSAKAAQEPQSGKRMASSTSQPKVKRARRVADDAVGNRWGEALSAAQPSVSKRGRATKLRRIFEYREPIRLAWLED